MPPQNVVADLDDAAGIRVANPGDDLVDGGISIAALEVPHVVDENDMAGHPMRQDRRQLTHDGRVDRASGGHPPPGVRVEPEECRLVQRAEPPGPPARAVTHRAPPDPLASKDLPPPAIPPLLQPPA